MQTQFEMDLIKNLEAIATQLKRTAELQKVNLWYLMEADQTTDRQKGILTEMLKKL